MRQWLHFAASAALALAAAMSATAADAFPVTIRVDAARPAGELRPIWRFFGADEPNYAYLKDGKKLLTELGERRPTHDGAPEAAPPGGVTSRPHVVGDAENRPRETFSDYNSAARDER